MASRHRIAASLVTVLALLASAPARADATPTPAEKETARSLMTQGRERREHNDLRGALEAFKSADALMHVPTTGFELARAQVALGQLVEARETIGQLLRRAARPDDPKPFVEARANAETLDDDLVKRIPTLHIDLRNATQPAAVSLDGVVLPAEAASAPLKVDPGNHVVLAGEGSARARAEVSIAERETKTVTLTLSPSTDASNVTEPSAPAASGHSHALLFTGIAVAGAGVAVGTITGVMSLSKTSAIKQSCAGNVCPATSSDSLASAHTTATVSTIAFAVAGAGALVAIGSLLFAPSDPPAASAGLHVAPWIGVGSAGLHGSF